MLRSSPDASAVQRVCALVAFISMLLVLTWIFARVHYVFGGNSTGIFCTGTKFGVPSDLAAGTYRIDGEGYDGQFYRYITHDPFVQKDYFRYLDSPRLRYRRILVPLAAWLLSLGQDAWRDVAYIAVEILFVGLGVYCCARLLARRGHSPLWGLLFLIVPATMASFERMLVDGPLAALFAGFLLYCDERRWMRVWLLAMLAALTRETALLLVAALVIDRLLVRDWRRGAWYASSAVPALAWYGYLAARLPREGSAGVLGIPIWGIVTRLFWFRTFPDPRVQLLVRVTDILAIVGLVLSIVIAIKWISNPPLGPVTICVGAFVGLALVLDSPPYMTEAFGFARPISPLLLWLMVEAVSRKTWSALVPPLLLSLSVSLVFASPFMTILKGSLGH